MPLSLEPELERLRYWQGQMLRSRDFNDQEMIDARLRSWHNTALHQARGVSLGLAVALLPPTTAPVAVKVSRGLAYDSAGRELLLEEDREVPLPASAAERAYCLVLQRDEGSPRGDCPPGPCASKRAAVLTVWRSCEETSPAEGVPIAFLKYDTKSQPSLDVARPPRYARALARPHLASGATLEGGTAWEVAPVPGKAKVYGIQTRINTAAAGFTEKPLFFAWLEGTQWDEKQKISFAAPCTDVADASPEGFTFRIWMPILVVHGKQVTGAAQSLAFARRQKLFVCWLGAEPSRRLETLPPHAACGCAPGY
jgi:hypothetical protein